MITDTLKTQDSSYLDTLYKCVQIDWDNLDITKVLGNSQIQLPVKNPNWLVIDETAIDFIYNKPSIYEVDSLAEYSGSTNMDIIEVSNGEKYINFNGDIIKISESDLTKASLFLFEEYTEQIFVEKGEVFKIGNFFYQATKNTNQKPCCNASDWRVMTQFDAVMIKCEPDLYTFYGTVDPTL